MTVERRSWRPFPGKGRHSGECAEAPQVRVQRLLPLRQAAIDGGFASFAAPPRYAGGHGAAGMVHRGASPLGSGSRASSAAAIRIGSVPREKAPRCANSAADRFRLKLACACGVQQIDARIKRKPRLVLMVCIVAHGLCPGLSGSCEDRLGWSTPDSTENFSMLTIEKLMRQESRSAGVRSPRNQGESFEPWTPGIRALRVLKPAFRPSR